MIRTVSIALAAVAATAAAAHVPLVVPALILAAAGVTVRAGALAPKAVRVRIRPPRV
jgi:hypothetical protein